MQASFQFCGTTMLSGNKRGDVAVDDCDHEVQSVTRNLEMMAYALSHDLRAPLRAIDGFSQALIEDLGDSLPATAARDLHEIRAGIGRMHGIINKWQSLIKGNACALQREYVDLSAMAQSIVNDLRIAEPSPGTEVRIAPGLHTQGDSVLLHELLQNLLGNAWKFTRTKAAQALIEFGTAGDGSCYFVRDNGIGIDAGRAHAIFKPMTRLANSAGVEGNGMGLAIVRYIVDAHGGSIWLDEDSVSGATFFFTLPAMPTPDASFTLLAGARGV